MLFKEQREEFAWIAAARRQDPDRHQDAAADRKDGFGVEIRQMLEQLGAKPLSLRQHLVVDEGESFLRYRLHSVEGTNFRAGGWPDHPL